MSYNRFKIPGRGFPVPGYHKEREQNMTYFVIYIITQVKGFVNGFFEKFYDLGIGFFSR